MQRSRFLSALVLAVVLMLVAPASARAAPGDLDTTFGGGDGVVTFDSGTNADTGQKILRQPDGKLVVAGNTVNQDLNADLFLARYRRNGTPDPAFGQEGSGIATVDFLGGDEEMWALSRMGDGRLVVAGNARTPADTGTRAAAARFLPNGHPDPSFSGDGKTSVTFPGYPAASVWRSLVLPDGKLVVVGEVTTAGDEIDLFAMRFRVNGTLDTAFSGDGRFALDLGGREGVWDLRRLPDGSLLLVGWSNLPGEGRTALVWLTPGGTLDHAHGGGDGKAVIDLVHDNSQEHPRAVFPLDTGKLLLVGNADEAAGGGTDQDLFVARLRPNGARDTTFGGGDGVVGIEGGDSEAIFGARRTPAGTIAVAGFRGIAFFVARLRPNGSADPAFGTGGFANPFGPGSSRANDLVVLSNGKIVVTGQVNGDVTTARLQG